MLTVVHGVFMDPAAGHDVNGLRTYWDTNALANTIKEQYRPRVLCHSLTLSTPA